MSALWWLAAGAVVACLFVTLVVVSALVAAGRADRLSEQMGEEAPVYPLAEARDRKKDEA